MNKLLKKLFIKNYQDTCSPVVRAAYGVFAGVVGIIFNVILFGIKLFAGILSGSVAVIADAVNNLSDFLTSIITIIGFKISGRPADKEHPFGHQRLEHVTALIVACVITFIGIETGRSALDKIINASATDFTLITLIILGVSILIKLYLYFFYKGLAKDINSDALKAMSSDSLNDVISTSVVLICAVIGMFYAVPLDGYLGMAVSILIVISAIKLIKETIDPLIGAPPDKEIVDRIKEKLKSYPDVLDIHDLIVHNYGPNKTFATVHIEVDSRVDVMISHDLSDNVEHDFYRDMNVLLVCHLDPVKVNDQETKVLKEDIISAVKGCGEGLSLHDFRVVEGVSHTNVIFDVVIPFGAHHLEREIRKAVEDRLIKYDKKYYAVIEFEHSFD